MITAFLAAALGQFVLAPKDPPQTPNPNPSPQASAAVPTPQGWGPPAAAAPATFPLAAQPQQAVVYQTPNVYQLTVPWQPVTYTLQAVQPAAAASPVFAPASSQFTAAAAPYVNPFVATAAAPAQPQQGIGTVALVGATLLADNPWIFDRILAHWGEHLHKRGMPVLRVAPPGTVVTTPSPAPPAASAAVVSFGQPGAFTVVSGPTHRTRFGRWFWGE